MTLENICRDTKTLGSPRGRLSLHRGFHKSKPMNAVKRCRILHLGYPESLPGMKNTPASEYSEKRIAHFGSNFARPQLVVRGFAADGYSKRASETGCHQPLQIPPEPQIRGSQTSRLAPPRGSRGSRAFCQPWRSLCRCKRGSDWMDFLYPRINCRMVAAFVSRIDSITNLPWESSTAATIVA